MLRVFATLVLCSVATAQVYQLTTDTFDVALQEGPLFVKFYAPWCARQPQAAQLCFSRKNSSILHRAAQF